MITHAMENCVGVWRYKTLDGGGERVVECDVCGLRFAATADIRVEAVDENYAGIYLRRLAEEGKEFLPK